MQNSLLLFFGMLLLGLGELQAQEGVLWYGDPDKSVNENFRRFDDDNPRGTEGCTDTPDNQGIVTTAIDSTYGKHWRIIKPATRKRAEFARMGPKDDGIVPQQGQLYYLGWRWRVNSTPKLSNGSAVFQWKSIGANNLQNYPFNLDYNGSELSLNAYGPKQRNGGSINQWRTRLWSRPVAENEWVTIVFAIMVSEDPTEGYIELWINGAKQKLSNSLVQKYTATISDDGRRAYHRTFDAAEVYPKWGSYGGGVCSYETVTDLQDMRLALTYGEARPRPAARLQNAGGNISTSAMTNGQDSDTDGLEADVELFPNPVTELLHLRRLPRGARSVSVLDLSGRRVVGAKPINGTEQQDLDTSALPAGIYLLEIALDGKAVRKRFVKQ